MHGHTAQAHPAAASCRFPEDLQAPTAAPSNSPPPPPGTLRAPHGCTPGPRAHSAPGPAPTYFPRRYPSSASRHCAAQRRPQVPSALSVAPPNYLTSRNRYLLTIISILQTRLACKTLYQILRPSPRITQPTPTYSGFRIPKSSTFITGEGERKYSSLSIPSHATH